ncbi:unnamed protein product [Alopecurus aequalis]
MEYNNIAILDHKNVVRLVGYCHETQKECIQYNGRMVFAEKTKRALCFEYMENGSLDKFISDEYDGHDWPTRYAIIKGICEGLEYLHEKLESPMYHLDLKPANVLLDKNMTPKIADFGLSRLFGGDKTQMTKSAIGTHGYVPPEYIDASVISIKFDIYSLGVVIIKIMTGTDGYFRSAEMSSQHFVELVHTNWMNRLKTTLVHPYSIQVRKCIEIALSCVEADRHKRPTIGVIINNLNKTDSTIQFPDALINASGSSNKILDAIRNGSGSSIDQVIDFPSKADKKKHGSSGMPGSVQLVTIKHMEKAPLFDHNTKVMLELTGGDYTSARPGLDLVAVLDVGCGMKEYYKMMDEVKTALRFVLQKLGPMDRLSIVTFGSEGTKLCPLRQINEASRQELQQLINRLEPHVLLSGGNITDGLRTGLKVLKDRKLNDGRFAAIMVVAANVVWTDITQEEKTSSINVPIYAFGICPFGEYTSLGSHMGGPFSFPARFDLGDHQTFGRLTMAFSQCLAGLLTVAVRNLELTVATVRGESMLLKVTAGMYPQRHEGGSVTVVFGDLYSREVRRVIVDLGLPTVGSERSAEILSVTYSYSSSGSSAGRVQYVVPGETLTVWRTGVEVLEAEVTPAEFQMEEDCLRTAHMMMDYNLRLQLQVPKIIKKKKKTIISRLWSSEKDEENNMHVEVQNMQVEAQNMQVDPLLKIELLEFLAAKSTSPQLGSNYLASFLSSHWHQRFAARGNIETMRLFATPRMDMYLEQAKRFLRYPDVRLPSTDQDDVASSQHPMIYDAASREEELRVLRLTQED